MAWDDSMTIGVATITPHLPKAHSLKDERTTIQSLIRTRSCEMASPVLESCAQSR